MALTEEGIIQVPGLLSRWVRLSTGVKAHYMTAGETGPDVVLLHGGIQGSSGTAGFRYMAPFLAANGFRVHCPDMPAFGLTEDPTNHYGYGQGAHIDFIHDFTRAIGLDTFHLAGNSMGCSNTSVYVVSHPEQVLSFALIAGRVGDLVPWEEMRKADGRPKEQLPKLGFDGSESSMRHTMEQIILDPAKVSDDVVAMRTLAANRNAEFWGPNMKRFHAPRDGRAPASEEARLRTRGRLDETSIPGIYLYGREDVLHRVEAGYVQEDALPAVQFFYPEDAGHQGQTDQPEVFNQTILEFFRDGKVSWETAQRAGISSRRPPLPSVVAVEAPVSF
ncbi:alpha/beta hydrolase [Streptomyces sp. NPDC005507]|uniref:alpha/beta fold hydrolase n=1 Tax=unclassified Streptomyces TaxID=2593676 RepID=UPI0033BF1291